MAKIIYTGNNKGFWRTGDFQAYDAVLTENQLEYTYGATAETELGPYSDLESPYRVVFHFADAEYETVVEGDNAGEERAIGGTVTGVTYYNQSGDVIMTGTGLDGDLPYLLTSFEFGDHYRLMDTLYAQPLVFVGTNHNGNGPDGWDGDNINTGFHDDIVRAKGGDDFIQDRGGSDRYIGGDGWDTVSYEIFQWMSGAAFTGIRANLKKGFIDGPDGHRDTVVSIESVRGTQNRDVFIGNGEDNGFMGFGGADVFKGGGGSDWAVYRNDIRDGGNFGINAKLNLGTIRDGFGSVDKVKSIENVVGTEFGDRFRDNNADNRFEGREGDDTFVFTRGNDRATGGAGADTFIFRGSAFADDIIEDFEDGIDVIQIEMLVSFEELTIYDDGDHKVVAWGDNSITLEFNAGTTIDENDFLLPAI